MKNRIRELRKEKDLSLAELARILEVSSRAVGFYETGDRDPDTHTLMLLADYFDVSIDYLLGHSDIRKSTQSEDLFAQIGLVIHRNPKPLTQKDKEKLLKIIDTAWPDEDNE